MPSKTDAMTWKAVKKGMSQEEAEKTFGLKLGTLANMAQQQSSLKGGAKLESQAQMVEKYLKANQQARAQIAVEMARRNYGLPDSTSQGPAPAQAIAQGTVLPWQHTPWPDSPLGQALQQLDQQQAQPASPKPTTVFGPMTNAVDYGTGHAAARAPFLVHVDRAQFRNECAFGEPREHILERIARRMMRSQLGATAERLARWRGADWVDMHYYVCRFDVPADLAPKPKYEHAPSQIPEVVTIEIARAVLGCDQGRVNAEMRRRLILMVGADLAERATVIAESYDGTRQKYVNVYRIPGGAASETIRKAESKPFERPAAGKRLIKIRKQVADDAQQ